MSSRPHYSPDIAAKICARMISGLSVKAIARQRGMPVKSTIMRWISERPEFRAEYLRAQEGRGCGYAEEAAACAKEYDEVIGDLRARRIEAPVAQAMVNAIRAKVDVFKWCAGRMAPRIYGEKVEHTGAGGGPIKHEHQHDLSKLSDAELDALEGIVGKTSSPSTDSSADPGREDETRH